jgi:protease IV
MNTKRWVAIGLSVVIFFTSVLLSAVSALLSGLLSDQITDGADFSSFWKSSFSSGEILRDGNPLQKIAVLEVTGTIVEGQTDVFSSSGYDHAGFLNLLDQIKEDTTVEALLLYVNSPGGGVYESAQIRDRMLALKEEKEIPMVVVMGSVAASGGYYISADADYIFASAETLTGSIGVIMSGLNIAGLMEMYGVEDFTVKSGEFKDIGSAYRPSTQEDREILQALIDSSYDRFLEIVANGRGLDKETARGLADGRIYDGLQAKNVGLVDEIGYLEDAVDYLSETYGLGDAQVYRYDTMSDGFFRLFSYQISELIGIGIGQRAPLYMTNRDLGYPRLMYLFGGY